MFSWLSLQDCVSLVVKQWCGECQTQQGRPVLIGRRSSVEILGEILRLGQAGKTEIMYKVNMSHAQLDRYLKFLTEKGLLERVLGKARIPLYVITEQGKELLTHIEAVTRFDRASTPRLDPVPDRKQEQLNQT